MATLVPGDRLAPARVNHSKSAELDAVTQFLKTTQIAIDGARTLPRRYYVAPEIFAEEAEKVFTQRWLCVGREDRIAGPGDYFVQQIGNESIIVLRDHGGALRAYYNVCRHRGTRLCEEHTGRFSETIQCPYHAWTYALDGRLIGAPSSSEIEGFAKADYPLHPVGIQRWEGFLFINLAEDPEPFAQAYQSLIGRFDRFNMSNLAVARTLEYHVKANWKLLFQNYSECYHCGPVHPPLAKLTPPTSGENDLVNGPVTGGFMARLRNRACSSALIVPAAFNRSSLAISSAALTPTKARMSSFAAAMPAWLRFAMSLLWVSR